MTSSTRRRGSWKFLRVRNCDKNKIFFLSSFLICFFFIHSTRNHLSEHVPRLSRIQQQTHGSRSIYCAIPRKGFFFSSWFFFSQDLWKKEMNQTVNFFFSFFLKKDLEKASRSYFTTTTSEHSQEKGGFWRRHDPWREEKYQNCSSERTWQWNIHDGRMKKKEEQSKISPFFSFFFF